MNLKMQSVGVLVVALGAAWMASAAQAQVPSQMSYQGVLLLDDGTVVPDDVYSIRFDIFDAAAAGNNLFSQSLSATVRKGLYSVALSGEDLVSAFQHPNTYMEVTLESGGGLTGPITLEPRQVLTSVPYAFVSGSGAGVPADAVMAFDAAACPPGWEEFPGAAGRVVLGAGDGAGLTPRTLGETGGEEDHQLTNAEMPRHHHHVGPIKRGVGGVPASDWNIVPSKNIVYDDAYWETTYQGMDQPHNNMPPYLALLYCKKL